MTPRLSALALALWTGPALAECPTADDLSGAGITMTHADGASDFLIAGEPGTGRAIVRFPHGFGGNNVYARGVHLLQLMDVWDGAPDLESLRLFDYGMAPTDLPEPTPGLSWEADYQVTSGPDTAPERQVQSWGALEERRFGDCTYQVIPGEIVYSYIDGSHTEGMLYFPDLGVSFLTSWQDGSMARPDIFVLEALHVGP